MTTPPKHAEVTPAEALDVLQRFGTADSENCIHWHAGDFAKWLNKRLADREREMRQRVFESFVKALALHIQEYPHKGNCDWNCTTVGPLVLFEEKVAERVKRETLEALNEAIKYAEGEMPQGDFLSRWRAVAAKEGTG